VLALWYTRSEGCSLSDSSERGKPVNVNEKRARLEEINSLLVEQVNVLTSEDKMPLYYEAMQLCEDLGLDRAWQRFKALLERLNQEGIAQKGQNQ
jgi:hypothetical protein